MLTLKKSSQMSSAKGEWTQEADIQSDDRTLASVTLTWRDHFMDGRFEVAGQRIEVNRETQLQLPVRATSNGEVLMRATSCPGHHCAIEYGARQLQIHLDSVLTTKWGILEDGQRLGTISRPASMKTLAKSDLPADMDLCLLAFILWLTVGRWLQMDASPSVAV